VVGTIMTNFGFTKFCDEQNIKFIATKVGDRFVLEEMNLCGYTLGGEQSGHIIFREYATTGDGQLTAVQLLSIMVKENKTLSQLAAVMTKAPQTVINLTVSANGKRLFYTDAAIKKAIDEATEELGAIGRIVVRPSGTEPLIRVMVEGNDGDLIDKIAKRVASVIELRLEKK
jgi:phosphoglucosamine mutase